MLRRLGFAVGVFAAVLVFGSLGYVFLEGWGLFDALYMTVITMGGVGYREVHPLSVIGQVWTMLVIVAGVGALGFTVVTVTDFMVEGHFSGFLEGRRMDKRIAGLSQHHVIAGLGRVGSVVAEEFAAQGVPFVVIDGESAALDRAREADWAWIEGDATEESVLEHSGIARARSLTAALDSDAANLFVTLTAKGMREGLFVVARATTPSAEAKLLRAGADRVITPTEIGGRRMAAMVLRPMVADYLDIVTRGDGLELKLEQIQLTDDDPFVDLTIAASHIRSTTGVFVLAVHSADGGVNTNPDPETVLRIGDRLVLLGTEEQLRTFASRACADPAVCYPDYRS
jgi:voltage-gated potassium channel